MSREGRKITDEDLHAYADGALDGEARAAVEAYLSAHPAAVEDVEAWRRQGRALRTLYGHVAAEPVPPRLSVHRLDREARTASGRVIRMAAAAVLLLAIGGGTGWFARDLVASPVAERTLVAAAVEAHGVYAGEVVHPVEVRADEGDHLRAWLSKRLARPLVVPDLRTDGLRLVGGRLLPGPNGPAAQLMYEDEGGRRVTLYIIPTENDGESSLRYSRAGRLEAFVWTDEAISCAIVGELPREALREIAVRAYRQLG